MDQDEDNGSTDEEEEIITQLKNLTQNVLENTAKYVCGDLHLNESMTKQDELYMKVISKDRPTVWKIQHDSNLMKIHMEILKQQTKAYTVDSLVFKPREFSVKVRNHFCSRLADENDAPKRESVHKIWEKLGQCSKDVMHTIPNFSFMYGAFDAVPIDNTKKRRKYTKDQVGELTKPEKVNSKAASHQQDVMLENTERLLAIFHSVAKRHKTDVMCFYEFVIDPQSFTRTIENIFLVSLLVKEGHLSVITDEQGLPCLRLLKKNEKDQWDKTKANQCIISLSMQEWENIIKTFDFKEPIIRPRPAQSQT
ncbi:non-structural maintenance of chromosomes element 4 homolog A [Caerostris darwini]|uniref:Non-structural maintenance of chromosomes element 4 n=1 Tax=Caerostris darwini TaxID=1538125 RepID=A0AAV4V2Y3_9ARAC|nr:non-structural maintenance of chromosomes element 4 homolog A [Caerostris darwini]